MLRTIGLFSIIIASTFVGICGANSAPADSQTSGQQTSGQVWSLQTPFGIVYGLIPHEVVDYPTTRAGGTIVLSTSQRRLYYVLGAARPFATALLLEWRAMLGRASTQLPPPST